MRHTAISAHQVAHQMVVVFWIIAGIIAVLVVGDAFTLLALAIVTTGWWREWRETTRRWLLRRGVTSGYNDMDVALYLRHRSPRCSCR